MRVLSNRITQLCKKLTPGRLLLLILLFTEAMTLLITVFTKGEIWGDLLFFDRQDTFMDFINPIVGYQQVSPHDLYSDAKAFYPPLAMLFYYGLYCLIPESIVLQNSRDARSHQFTLYMTAFYILVVTLMIAFVLVAICKGSAKKKQVFVWASIFSYPMLFQLDRVNIIILALLFTLIFLLWIDSDSRIKREFALIFLALAFGLKGYPALFGILLIVQKRWKEAIRCVLYGIAAFILPAFFFGGVNIMEIWKAFACMSSKVVAEGFGYKVNFANTADFFASCFGMGGVYRPLFNIISVVFGVLALLATLVPGPIWKKLCLITIVLVGLPSVSYAYVMIFFLIPTAAFLNETDFENQKSPLHYVYAVLLALCLAPIPICIFGYDTPPYPVTASVLTESLCVIVLIIVLLIDRGIALKKILQQRKEQNKIQVSQS